MRVRVATALGLTALTVLALPACSTEAEPASTSSTHSRKQPGTADQHGAPLPSAALDKRLLDVSDLGTGYTRKPERPAQHDDVTVLGCPALNGLGGDAATGGSLDFPRRAKATFTYGHGGSEVSEELYSDTSGKLSGGTNRIFEAITSCPQYQLLAGGIAVDTTTQKLPPPQAGEERWSQLMTFSAGGRDTVVKQTAVRDGNVLVVVSGSPALVDQHLTKALTKATAAR
ncbi:hypothetical protein A6A06_01335 [Streptomyces sp. CB02923]|uniref:hypothetical protein n=1 Tax=Streptomyces sp. CB02923 TaxID=1718985 RepID=UPI00093BAAA3|nr:hypothetical protein [Streptomyces sp. CB02923]OKI09383.1 hypothetical protein A6A06_01335 [Streptomyces sp. CB02923]